MDQIKVVLEFVDDSDIQVNYYLEGKLLDINYLNELFYKKEESLKNYRDLARFKFAMNETHYINRSIYKNDSYTDYHGEMREIPTLPESINIENAIQGICEMVSLGSELGAYTPIYVKYNNVIEQLTKSREGKFENDALLLLLEYLKKNNISYYGLKFDDMSLDEFYRLTSYTDMLVLGFTTPELEPYSKILNGKIKSVLIRKSNKSSNVSDNQNIEKEDDEYEK